MVAPNGSPPAYPTEVLMISSMRAILPKAFPILKNRDKWSHPWGVSGPQSSPARGGHYGGKMGGQLVKAKATDIYLDADKPTEKKLGDLLFKGFVEHRNDLGIDFVVWDQQKSKGEDVAVYPKPPKTCPAAPVWTKKSCLHQDHLHVEFDRIEGDKDHSGMLRTIVDSVKLALSK
jgi:hypothetical protein